jgi:hypothetical protein
MTWWPPLDVLGFALSAGWSNDDAKRAATVALVASQGADHHTYDPACGPGFVQRGLWSISAAQVDSVGGGDQLHPLTSAQTARALWLDCGRKWSWHPVVAGDGGALVWRTLDALNLDNLWSASAKESWKAVAHLRDLTYTSKRIERIMAQYPTD